MQWECEVFKMIKLTYFAAIVVVSCLSAPIENVQHPSLLLSRPTPINPDIPTEPKPQEKVTLITDPVEIAKHKREAHDEREEVVKPTVLLGPVKAIDLLSPKQSSPLLDKPNQKRETEPQHSDHTHHHDKDQFEAKKSETSTEGNKQSSIPVVRPQTLPAKLPDHHHHTDEYKKDDHPVIRNHPVPVAELFARTNEHKADHKD